MIQLHFIHSDDSDKQKPATTLPSQKEHGNGNHVKFVDLMLLFLNDSDFVG